MNSCAFESAQSHQFAPSCIPPMPRGSELLKASLGPSLHRSNLLSTLSDFLTDAGHITRNFQVWTDWTGLLFWMQRLLMVHAGCQQAGLVRPGNGYLPTTIHQKLLQRGGPPRGVSDRLFEDPLFKWALQPKVGALGCSATTAAFLGPERWQKLELDN